MTPNNPQSIWEKMQTGVFIIAEAGKNFIQTQEEQSVEVYLRNAKQLVDEAALAGADAIKFQTHNYEDEQLNIDVISPHFKGSDRYSWVKRNSLATPVETFWKPLKAYCDEKGIIFFSTPMSRGAAQILHEQVGQPLFKIGSGDILDFVMLDYIRNLHVPVIFSTGMSTLEEVEKAVKFLREKNSMVTMLHCVSKYPCPPEELRLGTMNFYREKFDMPIGFSDHSIGIEPDLVAVAMGATVLEKHFSLSRELWGSDHKVSMTPAELKALVEGTNEILNSSAKREEILASEYAQKSLGTSEKVLQEDEAAFRPLFRKSLMAGMDIAAGTVITSDMLYAMRPQMYAGGLPSEEYVNVLGKVLKKDLKKFDPVTVDIFE